MTLNDRNRRGGAVALMRTMTSIMILVLLTTVAFATENEYAKNASAWVLDGAFWIIVCLGIIFMGMAFVKRNVSLGIGILIGAAAAAYFCKNPEQLGTLGDKLAKIIGL